MTVLSFYPLGKKSILNNFQYFDLSLFFKGNFVPSISTSGVFVQLLNKAPGISITKGI